MSDRSLKKCVRGGGSAEEVKKKILVRAVNTASIEGDSVFECRCSYSEFQILDLHSGKFSKTGFTLLGDAGIGTIVSLGSVIYTLGKPRDRPYPPDYSVYYSHCKGDNDIVAVHEGLSYFDLNHPEFGWRKGPLVNEDQYFPICVALYNNLYVFRSTSTWSCFGEVFYPNLNSWNPLPEPPFSIRKFRVSPPLVSDPLHGRILLHLEFSLPFHSSIYAYYPADERFDCLVDNFDGDWVGPLVFLDGVIYFYAPKSKYLVQAYDLHNKLWLKVVLSSEFEEDFSRCVFDALHHLGDGLLCFTTFFHKLSHFDPTASIDHSVVLAVQFKVQRAEHHDQVLLTPVSSLSSPLDSFCRIYGHIAL